MNGRLRDYTQAWRTNGRNGRESRTHKNGNGFHKSTLRKVQDLVLSRQVGPLGTHLIMLCTMQSANLVNGSDFNGARRKLQSQFMEDLRQEVIGIEFGRYSSPSEILEGESSGAVVVYTEVQKRNVIFTPNVYHWTGSPDEIDRRMREDVQQLKRLGFSFKYRGYRSERDSLVI